MTGALTAPQLRLLLKPVNPRRVNHLKGLAHMEAWDIRRQLIRTFGFGGYDLETLALDLVAEASVTRRKKSREGVEYGEPYEAWTVIYRAQVRLTVKDTEGRVLASWDDGAVGDSQNQPVRGDAHDMAMKTALSQALKRCATNLGDQFGLSLYNDGSTDAVVNWSAAHPPEIVNGQGPAVEMPDDDRPVLPERQPVPAEAESAPVAPAAPAPETAVAPTVQPNEVDVAYADMMEAARAIGFEEKLPGQFKQSFGHDIKQGTAAEYRQAAELMRGAA